MKKVIRIPLVLIIILIIAIILCLRSFASTTGIITQITVNVREKASIDSKVIMFVTQDDKVEILEKTGDWYKIKYKNKTGYVYDEFVKVDEEVKKTTDNKKEQEKLETEDEEVTKNVETKFLLAKNTGVKITPNIVSEVIYTADKDTQIQVLEKINGWSYISINDIRGWVRSEQITEGTVQVAPKEEKVTPKNEIAYVKYEKVNLRKEPSTDSSIIEKLKLNTEVTIIESIDSVWDKVKVDGNVGYISKDLLASTKQEKAKEEKEETTTSRSGETTNRKENTTKKEENNKETNKKKEETNQSASVTGADIVAYAKKYLGYDYVYGGSSPKTGFDCSGFTSYVYKHFGYNIARTSGGQAKNGVKVEKKDLKPGDLVIYKNTSLTKIGHVGIYIGDNKMIHASTEKVGVVITDINSKGHKYPERYVMGRRIIK